MRSFALRNGITTIFVFIKSLILPSFAVIQIDVKVCGGPFWR